MTPALTEPNYQFPHHILNRHDFWRACYATMLSEVPLDAVAAFFQARPFEMNGETYSGARLLRHLWKPRGDIPMDWNYHGVDDLERFLVEQGCDARGFMRKMLFRNNQATYMPGKVVLSWFYPVMERVYSKIDMREMVFKFMDIFVESYLPGHLHRRLKRVVQDGWIHSYNVYACHAGFQWFGKFNFDLIAGEQILAVPRNVGLPPFEDISYHGDVRRLEEVLWDCEVRYDLSALYLEGAPIARRASFHSFLKDLGIAGNLNGLPDWEVFVATRDIRCPRRNRIVVYDRCAYGAPAYIYCLRHKPLARKEAKLLEHLIRDGIIEEDLFSPEVVRRHEQLVDRLELKLDFVYFPRDESIGLNQEKLVKGVPAKVLFRILTEHVRNGRKEFEYWEFKRDEEISLGQKNSNFEVRLYRLIETLQEKCPSFRIVRAGRGRLKIEVDGKVTLSESR